MIVYILLIGLSLVSFIIQIVLKSKFTKYSKIRNLGGLSGAEVAKKMLEDHNIHNVSIQSVSGTLTDHYNPSTRTVNLSAEVYNGRSIAAAAVAAHECGHVIQDAYGYGPLKLRSSLVPVVSFCSSAVQWVILLGFIFLQSTSALLWIGIVLYAMTTLFSVITLPVEINASRRAIAWIERSNLADMETLPKAKDALSWAAYTYIIAALSSIVALVYYILIARARD